MRMLFLFGMSALCISCNPIQSNKHGKIEVTSGGKPQNFDCNYSENRSESKRLLEAYKNAPDTCNRQRFLNFIRDSLFACWLGTAWDFNGTTEEPNNGKIACGYFVTTLLRDMGIKVSRIKHAQCASEEMIFAVCIKNTIARCSNENISRFIQRINAPGLYIVGLDFHTGFIMNDGNETYFIHANYTGKQVVEKEIAVKSSVLASSKYRVIGKVI